MGEFVSFCKDFGIGLYKNKIIGIFKQVSEAQKPLNYEQFKESIGILGMVYCESKTYELQQRLREIRHLLEYPTNKEFITLSRNILTLI